MTLGYEMTGRLLIRSSTKAICQGQIWLMLGLIVISLLEFSSGSASKLVSGRGRVLQAATATNKATQTNLSSFKKGMVFVSWKDDEYASAASDQSLTMLASTGANWVGIVVTVYQKTLTDTEMAATALTPSDAALEHVIATAHSLGLSVLLKPHIDLEVSSLWRGDIGFSTEKEWQRWFTSYRQMIDHYADLAQDNQVEMLCIGTELKLASQRASDWKQVVSGIRAHFDGKLTYASNFDEVGNIKWWGELDYIGVDAYYPLPTTSDNPTVENLKAAWVKEGHLTELQRLSQRYHRPVLVTEIGYRSVEGANKTPWEWHNSPKIDTTLQANLYQAALETFMNREWVMGIFFWNWLTSASRGGSEDSDYTPQNKPAQTVLERFYGQ